MSNDLPDYIELEQAGGDVDYIRELCSQLINLDAEIDGLEAVLATKKLQRDRLKQVDIPEAIQAQGLVDVNFADIGKVSIKEDFYVSVLADDRERWHQWLRENNHAGVIRMQETVHHQTQRALVKEQLAKGQAVPDFVKITPYKTTSIKR